MNQVKQLHAHFLIRAIDQSTFLIEKLLEIPNIPYAHALFDQIPQPNAFLYNKLIQAYASHGPHRRCLSLYTQMCRHGCSPNHHSFTFLFSACASLALLHCGQTLHACFLKSGFGDSAFTITALIHMYSKLGLLALARQVFEEVTFKATPMWNSIVSGYAKSGDLDEASRLFGLMPSRNVVSWTTMISGFAQNGRYEEALEMFMRMEKESDVCPNEVTIASVLPACANLGALDVGERIELYAKGRGYFRNLFVANAFLEMYAKCGKIDTAKRVFDEIRNRRDLCSWNSMIMGLAVHGRSEEALQFFHKMEREGIKPDDVTFVGVLLACIHGGLVKEGRELFKAMERNFSITPKLEHYGCLVDLLGRAGKLHEAYDVIKSMPMKPDSVVWGVLLGACSFHNRQVELAEIAANALFELEPGNPGNYIILSNIYASAGHWEGVAKLRKFMKGQKITKAAGYSFFEGDGNIHKFIVDDKSHPRFSEICAVLQDISAKMKLLSSSSSSMEDDELDLITCL